jgi:hypothetical protein
LHFGERCSKAFGPLRRGYLGRTRTLEICGKVGKLGPQRSSGFVVEEMQRATRT